MRERESLSIPARSESGQAMVEFALTMLLLMAFILFFVQLSFIFAYGSYVQYATFMSSRAYTSGGPSQSEQADRAKAVIESFLTGASGKERFSSIGKGIDGDGSGITGLYIKPPAEFGDGHNRPSSWMQGIRYRFRSKVFLLPLGKSKPGQVNSLDLTSESWLGRDPSFRDCQDYMGKFPAIFDNGC